MNLTINTFPGFSFFFPASFRATRQAVAHPRVVEALGSSQLLQKGASLVIDQAARAELICLEGTLWIMPYCCGKDLRPKAGKNYIASSSATMLGQARQVRSKGVGRPRIAQ